MTTLYKRHDVTTIAEVNALALSDKQENGSIVLGPYNETCSWVLPYAVHNEPITAGYWSYQDGYGGDLLRDGDEITVLVPVEAEEEHTRAEPFADGTIHVSPQYWRDEPSRRLATPWQPSPDRRGDCA